MQRLRKALGSHFGVTKGRERRCAHSMVLRQEVRVLGQRPDVDRTKVMLRFIASRQEQQSHYQGESRREHQTGIVGRNSRIQETFGKWHDVCRSRTRPEGSYLRLQLRRTL